MVMRFGDLPEEVRERVLREKAEELLDAWFDNYEEWHTEEELTDLADRLGFFQEGGE